MKSAVSKLFFTIWLCLLCIPIPLLGQTFRLPADTAEWQIALARNGFSPGSIDGVYGSQTRSALIAYQTSKGLPKSGDFDSATAQALQIQDPVFTVLEVSQVELDRLRPKPASWQERGQMDYMGYSAILEWAAEQSQSHPDYIKRLNPGLDWSRARVGTQIRVPLIEPFEISSFVGYIQIRLSERTLQVYSREDRILFHCPVSIARRVENRPHGELRIVAFAADPNYTFDPKILTGIAQREGIKGRFIIPSGPNNPVGTRWISLNRPGYGIHGTPEPEQVGRTESHGCFRLANWNAQTVFNATRLYMPVYVEP